MPNEITIDASTFTSLPEEVQNAVLVAVLGRTAEGSAESDAVVDAPAEEESDNLTPLNLSQTRAFMKGVNARSVDILRLFAQSPTSRVAMKDVMKAGGYAQWQETRGFLSGLTKRVRSITNDRSAWFYGWYDAGNAADGFFFVHPTTHASLRRYFAVD